MKKYWSKLILLMFIVSLIVAGFSIIIVNRNNQKEESNPYTIIRDIIYNGVKIHQGNENTVTVFLSFNCPWCKIFVKEYLPYFINTNFTVIVKPLDFSNQSIYLVCANNISYHDLVMLYDKNLDFDLTKCNKSTEIIRNYILHFRLTNSLGVPTYFVTINKNVTSELNRILSPLNITVNELILDNKYSYLFIGVLPREYFEKILLVMQ